MAAEILFTCTKMHGKKGVLKNDNGYREVILGGFNIHNATGDFYPMCEELKKIFSNSSDFSRRINNGQLYGERDHPKILPGMTERAFMHRALEVHMDNVCHHIRSVRLDTSGVIKDKYGKPAIAVIGDISPSGPHAAELERSFNNSSENTAFSIRSFTKDTIIGGTRYREVHQIVTWDRVLEPGIEDATKYASPATESYALNTLYNRRISEDTLVRLSKPNIRDKDFALATESASRVVLTAEQLLRSIGWQVDTKQMPSCLRW
jgi:hypothetical protein